MQFNFESGSAPKSFEEQFAQKEALELVGGKAEVLDLKPENPKSEVPVFFAPAWGCTMETYKPALKVLMEQERRVLTLDHPRRGGDMAEIPEDVLQKYPNQEVRKAYNLLGLLEAKGIEKTDVIAHSEGAVNAVIAAVLHPEKFRNLVLFAPAGLIGKDSFFRLLKGFAGQSKRAPSYGAQGGGSENGGWDEIPVTETEKQVAATAGKEALEYMRKNVPRAVAEAWNISQSQILEILAYLHDRGINISVMATVDDPVFPMERMQKTIGKNDVLDGFLSLRGGHGAIGDHPDRYMVQAEKMLAALQAKRGEE